jgi:hypothetical protein
MPLFCIENIEFQALVKFLNPGLFDYLYISDSRCRLGAGVVEALECENRWVRADI